MWNPSLICNKKLQAIESNLPHVPIGYRGNRSTKKSHGFRYESYVGYMGYQMYYETCSVLISTHWVCTSSGGSPRWEWDICAPFAASSCLYHLLYPAVPLRSYAPSLTHIPCSLITYSHFASIPKPLHMHKWTWMVHPYYPVWESRHAVVRGSS